MIIKYTNEYLDECVNLFSDIFINEPWNYQWMTKENVLRYFKDLENTPCFIGTIFFIDNILSGFCFGVTNNYFGGNIFEIKEIAVKRELQGKGYGNIMISEIECFLKKSYQVEMITLFTQMELPAYKFYLKNGFTAPEGAVFMSKVIDQ